jgi:hypothetical protein
MYFLIWKCAYTAAPYPLYTLQNITNSLKHVPRHI